MANTKVVQKMLRIQKEGGHWYDFCGVADNVVWRFYMHIIHTRAMIFCTYDQAISIISNINKISQ